MVRLPEPTGSVSPLSDWVVSRYDISMKETKTTVKLTPSQAYALQVKADRRAAAIERQGNVVREDNVRVDAMFIAAKEVAPRKVAKVAKATKKVRWTGPELDYLIDRYLVNFNKADGTVNYAAINDEFATKFPKRGTTGVQMAVCQIRGLDTWVVGEGLTDTSQALIDKLYAADPVRFPGGANAEVKVMNALDLLLAELR